MTSMIVAACLGTWTVPAGRGESDDQSGQGERGHRGRDVAAPSGTGRGHLSEEGEVREANRLLAVAAPLGQHVHGGQHRDDGEQPEPARIEEAHRRLLVATTWATRSRNQSRSVESTRWEAPARRTAVARVFACSAAASAKRRRNLRSEVWTSSRSPVSGSTSVSRPDGRKLPLPGIFDGDDHDLVAEAERPQLALPAAGVEQVGDDDDQAAATSDETGPAEGGGEIGTALAGAGPVLDGVQQGQHRRRVRPGAGRWWRLRGRTRPHRCGCRCGR